MGSGSGALRPRQQHHHQHDQHYQQHHHHQRQLQAAHYHHHYHKQYSKTAGHLRTPLEHEYVRLKAVVNASGAAGRRHHGEHSGRKAAPSISAGAQKLLE